MAEEKKQGSSGLATALPVTALLAILTSWFFNYSSPYQDERPSARPVQAQFARTQNVDARLWQDPFAAIDGVGESTPPEQMSMLVNQTAENNAEQTNITVLAITVPGGPYQEDTENRMRRRYAVLSGLAAQNAYPQDEQHIGYFQPEPSMALQKKVPFEWWSIADQNRKILLLWIDEASLLNTPAEKLKKLLIEASPKNISDQIHYRVIGPNSSTILKAMVKELEGVDHNTPKVECPQKSDIANTETLGKINGNCIEYFAASATASDTLILENPKESVSDFFSHRGVKLHRTIATDDKMMAIIIKELNLRQISIDAKNEGKACETFNNSMPDHVVILSEWDTFYGRKMPRAFETEWVKQGGSKKCMHEYSYVRGLDGKLPDKSDKASNAAEKKADSKDKSSTNSLIELPEGQSQKDYLRRLTGTINELDKVLKTEKHKKGVAAIGVLGSDVHDKLMILEALRQHFPHKLYFTTDLDAIYSHPSKFPQTHNMLVASGYDLKLRPGLQGNIPPFRDSYQTAIFLATQLILLKDAITLPTPSPRLFEIGRNHAIALPTREKEIEEKDMDSQCSWEAWKSCNKNVQPLLYASSPFNGALTSAVATKLLLLALVPFLVSWRVRILWREYLLCVAVVLTLVYFLNGRWESYSIKQEAEPFYWLEGISIWPSQVLRFLALLFAGGFIFWGHKRITKMQIDLTAQPTLYNHEAVFALPTDLNQISRWAILFVSSWKQNYDGTIVNSPDFLWQEYRSYSRWPKSLCRVFLHTLLFFLIAAQVIGWEPPNVPARGDIAVSVNIGLILVLVVTTVSLTFWVVDNARLCDRLIYNLSQRPSRWNSVACERAVREHKVARECVHDWLDIQLVLRLTESIQPLIWGPMVCIVLLVMARNPGIDDWDMPWELGIVLLVMLLYAISAELFLQRGATYARAKAIVQLTRKVIEQGNEKMPNEFVIRRIEEEIERIKMLRRGAFGQWYEWPLWQSFGGLSTLMLLLEYFAGTWGKGTF